MPEFDWYQATVPTKVDDLVECLEGLCQGVKISHARGHHGYASTVVLGSAEWGDVARIWHGGEAHEYPHALLSGDWAPKGAELIRARFPEHKVARVDVREDFGGDDTFDRMQGECLEVAAARRVKVGTAGDHLLTKLGRTVYLGSTKADTRLRLYDKAAEMRQALKPPPGVDQAAWFKHRGIPDHLTRLEAQVRPHTPAAKLAFSSVSPTQALGASAWMRDVWSRCVGLEVEPIKVGKGWRQSDDERAYQWLLESYGPLLRRVREDLGSWECVGLQLGQDLAAGNRNM